MVIQAITGQRCTAHAARSNVQNWGLRAGKYVAVSVDLRGEEMYHFLGKLIDVVMPRIRDWRGVKGSSGDDNGNISFGFKPDVVALFPEVEVNYDSYPPKMIPGCRKSSHDARVKKRVLTCFEDISVKTSATTDKDARMLLRAIGIPFYGNMIR